MKKTNNLTSGKTDQKYWWLILPTFFFQQNVYKTPCLASNSMSQIILAHNKHIMHLIPFRTMNFFVKDVFWIQSF